MAVVGAKGTFAGAGGTSSGNSTYRRRELVCDEIGTFPSQKLLIQKSKFIKASF